MKVKKGIYQSVNKDKKHFVKVVEKITEYNGVETIFGLTLDLSGELPKWNWTMTPEDFLPKNIYLGSIEDFPEYFI